MVIDTDMDTTALLHARLMLAFRGEDYREVARIRSTYLYMHERGTLDADDDGILDLMVSKSWAIKLATEVARTVLSVDQIIVARQAGGPKPPGPNPYWDED